MMKKTIFRISFLALTLLLTGLASGIKAQTRELYVISAKAGAVNNVSGLVSVQKENTIEWQPVTINDRIESGETLQTGFDGRIEMLLNPGSYFRVGGQSLVELTDASLDNLQIKVARGSVIFELTGVSGTELITQVLTPQGTVNLIREGLYRINVAPDGQTEILLHKGRVKIGTLQGNEIKDKKRIVLTPAGPIISKFEEKKAVPDDLDAWSTNRAKTLSEANARLTDNRVSSALTGYRTNGAFGYGYAPYFGLWMFDPFLSCYTLYPFYGGWRSPYGFWYDIGYGLPWYWYRPVPPIIVIRRPHPGIITAGGGNPPKILTTNSIPSKPAPVANSVGGTGKPILSNDSSASRFPTRFHFPESGRLSGGSSLGHQSHMKHSSGVSSRPAFNSTFSSPRHSSAPSAGGRGRGH